jgi:Ser/Thr protein kinase RdoA (MazF antagonist)
VAARPRALRRRGRLGLTLREAAAAFGLEVGSLRRLGGETWSDGEVVLRVGERVEAEVRAAAAASACVPVPRVLGQIDGAVLLELMPGRPAGDLADPERAAAAGRACAGVHERLRDAPVLHLDLHPFNVLLDDEAEVTGVIDWANASAGDPELDAARTWSILTLDPAALELRARPGWVALTEAWLDGLGEVPAGARAWACRFMLDDLAERHDRAALQHVREALRRAEGTP